MNQRHGIRFIQKLYLLLQTIEGIYLHLQLNGSLLEDVGGPWQDLRLYDVLHLLNHDSCRLIHYFHHYFFFKTNN